MKTLLTLALLLISAPVHAQTVSLSFPFVNPFGQRIDNVPHVAVTHGKPIGKGYSFFALAGASLEEEPRSLMYTSFAKSVPLPNEVKLTARVGDFRAFGGSLAHWANGSVTIERTSMLGTVSFLSDNYVPIADSSTFMSLNGLSYRTPAFGPKKSVTAQTRLSHVNYGGWVLDSRVTATLGATQVNLRGVVGFTQNVSIGISQTF